MKIKQVFVPYWEWEDWINGMWSKAGKERESELLKQAIEFTGDWGRYGAAMGEVIQQWPKTILNTFTNVSVNRRAFLGHCAVCYKLKIPEYIVRQAWGLLTDQQRFDADAIAQKHINHWEYEYKISHTKLHTGLGSKMLF